jgi:hypothetical protein
MEGCFIVASQIRIRRFMVLTEAGVVVKVIDSRAGVAA